MNGNGRLYLMLALLLVLAVVYVGLQGVGGSEFSMPAKAQRALEQQGYQPLEYRGYEFYACGRDADGYNFAALNPAGVQVNVTACKVKGYLQNNQSFWIVTR